MAQPQAVVMAPHNYTSTLAGLAPTVHVSTVIPNFCIAEYFGQFPGSVPRHCLDRHPLLAEKDSLVDHLLVESVKAGDLTNGTAAV